MKLTGSQATAYQSPSRASRNLYRIACISVTLGALFWAIAIIADGFAGAEKQGAWGYIKLLVTSLTPFSALEALLRFTLWASVILIVASMVVSVCCLFCLRSSLKTPADLWMAAGLFGVFLLPFILGAALLLIKRQLDSRT
jgi:hypothetical protein